MKPRIKVLKCILDSRFGGPHRRSFAIARRLREEGVETVFLFGYRGSRLEGVGDFEHYYLKHLQFMMRKHPVINFFLFLCFLPFNVLRIRHLIKAGRIDIVDVDGVTNPVPALTGRLCGVPVIWCYNDHPPGPIKCLLMPWIDWLSTRVIVQGERLRRAYTDSRPRLQAKTIVLPPGIDTSRFDPSRCTPAGRLQLRQQWGVSPDCPLVGIVGNLNPMKGHGYFIEAAHQVKQRVPNARFIIVGRRVDSAPGYWDTLHKLISRLELSEDIVFTDYRDDIQAVLSAFDVFVLSSILESCPNVVLEAMAMKVPVVATDVGAVAELLDGGKVGIVVPPGDGMAIAKAVLACLARSTDEVETVTDAARKRVETLFGLDRIARLQLAAYQALT